MTDVDGVALDEVLGWIKNRGVILFASILPFVCLCYFFHTNKKIPFYIFFLKNSLFKVGPDG